MRYNKRIKPVVMVCLLCIGMVALTGCDSLDYTTEQEDVIANYAANILLRHDKNYKSDYISEEETTSKEEDTEVTEEETTTVDNSVNGDGINGDTNVGKVSSAEDVTSALHLPDGVTAQYVDYDIVDQYPDDSSTDIFVMKAVANSKLLVVKFNITNTTSQDISINIMSSVQKFKGIVNDAKKYNAQLTLLLDALNTYEGTLKAGTSQTLILVYQTQLDEKDDVKSLSVELTDISGNESVLNLK